MFTALLEKIKEFDTIIIHRHSNPDGDALGSQIGLKNIIKENFPEKTVYAVGDMTARYAFMEGSEMDVIDDAVYENEQGQTCVLAALEQEDGSYLICEYAVTTGMDDDLDLVIEGPEICEGLRIIHVPDLYRSLVGQTAQPGTIKAASMFDQMSAMMG